MMTLPIEEKVKRKPSPYLQRHINHTNAVTSLITQMFLRKLKTLKKLKKCGLQKLSFFALKRSADTEVD